MLNSSNAEIEEILNSLLTVTRSGKLLWKSVNDGEYFRANAHKFAYTVESRDRDDQAPYLLEVYHLAGEELGQKIYEFLAIGNGELVPNARDLFQSAKASAFGIPNGIANAVVEDLGLL